MDEEDANRLYTLFQQVDKGAKQKQGLGFAGAGAARHGFAERDDDEVIARNKRLFGSVHGPGSGGRDQGTASDGYDSDRANAVVRRLKQLKKEQGKVGAAAAPAAAGAKAAVAQVSQQQRGSGRQRSRSRSRSRERSGSGWRGNDRERHRSSRGEEYDRDRHRSSRGEEYDRDRHRSSRGDRREGDKNGSHGGRASREGGRQPHPAQPAKQQQQQRLQQQQQPDFERLIPGYASMSAAQKLKARTSYMLERSSQQDRQAAAREPGGVGGQWTRYNFDLDAHLDEEGGRPADAAEDEEVGGGGALAAAGGSGGAGALWLGLGLGLGRLNAVTFKASVAQAQLQDRDASHEAAIFGRGALHEAADEGAAMLREGPAGGAAAAAAVVAGGEAGEVGEEEQPAVVVEEQAGAQGAQLGWRERAALLKAQRAKAGA